MADSRADHRYSTHLKNELEREEALLKSVKDKLVDQLQRLKVEELALVNYLSMSNSSSCSSMPQTASSTGTSTGTYFSAIQGNSNEADKINEEVNNMPLPGLSEGLPSNSLILSNQPDVEQEEEEDED